MADQQPFRQGAASPARVDWLRVQRRLGVPQDGIPGPRTFAAMFSYMAGCDLGNRADQLGGALAARWTFFVVTSPLRLAHFLGQTAHESGGFRFFREIWGPTAAQRGYEGRSDLGNVQPGDGRRYLGRGLIQITGRANYREVGARLGLPLVENPASAEEPATAVLTALDWWAAHGCNGLADADDARGLSRLINRGSPRATRPANGEAERLALTAKAKLLLV